MAAEGHWYAVRTMPGFQAPHRERWPEPNASALQGKQRGRGYIIASAITPDRSKIEANLDDAGFVHYMPAEYVAVRKRQKAGLYELRRFALLKGYIFVELADRDWLRLYDVPGIRGVVENCGHPFAISTLDLFRLRMYEQNNRAVAQAKVDSLSKAGERIEREKRKGVIKGARKKLFPGREVKLIWGDKAGHDATVQAWEDQDQVRVLLSSLEAATETITVPFEFLKAAS
jgi:transcription antitermination factor NusG